MKLFFFSSTFSGFCVTGVWGTAGMEHGAAIETPLLAASAPGVACGNLAPKFTSWGPKDSKMPGQETASFLSHTDEHHKGTINP